MFLRHRINIISQLGLFFALIIPLAGFAQTGPGGVGNSANTRLWLKADAGLYTDAGVTPATNGSSIQQWNDFSGNGFTLNQLTGTKKPVLAADVFSGYPAVRFDGIDDIINGSASNAIIGNNQPNLTAFTVFRTQVSTDSRMWSFKRDAGTNPLFEAVFNNGGTRNGGFYTRRAGGGQMITRLTMAFIIMELILFYLLIRKYPQISNIYITMVLILISHPKLSPLLLEILDYSLLGLKRMELKFFQGT